MRDGCVHRLAFAKLKHNSEPFETLSQASIWGCKIVNSQCSDQCLTESEGASLFFNIQDVNINEEMIRKKFAYRDVSCTADEQELGKSHIFEMKILD